MRFVDRFDNGYFMTDAGRIAMAAAERVETEIKALEVMVRGKDERLTGRIRLTCMDAFATQEAPGVVARFRARYPEIAIDVSPGYGAADLGRREAEVAVRATRKPPETSFGRRIGRFRVALYASPGYMEAAGDRPLTDHSFCFVEGMAAWLAPAVWPTREEAEDRAVFQCAHAASVLAATALGLGITAMPCYAGDSDPRIVRVSDPIPALDMDLWVLTHPDLRSSARVRALLGFLYEDLGSRKDLWSGAGAPSGRWNLLPAAA